MSHIWYNLNMSYAVQEHREARKEYSKLPDAVRQKFDVVIANIGQDPRAPLFQPKKESGWRKRTMLGVGFSHKGTSYRVAWEIDSNGDALIWSYGPHEGFWARVATRARR